MLKYSFGEHEHTVNFMAAWTVVVEKCCSGYVSVGVKNYTGFPLGAHRFTQTHKQVCAHRHTRAHACANGSVKASELGRSALVSAQCLIIRTYVAGVIAMR